MTPDEKSPSPKHSRLPEDGIGERIRQRRELQGLSQAKLAELTKVRGVEGRGIPRSVLVGYESGRFKPGARELRVLSTTLEIDVATLLYGPSNELKQDMARAEAMLFGSTFADLPTAMRIGFGLMRLKDHEREAFGTLIHGLVVRTFKRPEDAKLLDHVVDMLAIDLMYRVGKAVDTSDARGMVERAIAGDKGLDQLAEALERLVDAIPSED
jgi:transcriptional regulator with XRE-family HTH domain